MSLRVGGSKASSDAVRAGGRRRNSGRALLGGLVLLALGTTPTGAAAAPLEICEEQQYALCATASCFVFNLVAYCKCDVEFGDSITETDSFDGGDACSVNEQGASNGYMVSTYSLPPSAVAGSSTRLTYTEPPAKMAQQNKAIFPEIAWTISN